MKRHLLVTGCHRCGSTYVGHVIARVKELSYIEEPFNFDRGIKGVQHWFPYANTSMPNYYSKLVDDFFRLKIAFKYDRKGAIAKRILKRIIGNRPSLRMNYYRTIGRLYSSMLIKDPLASFLSNYMHRNHNVNVLVLVRHPMAFYCSLRRLGWEFDFRNFLAQQDLIDRHLCGEARLIEKRFLSDEEKVGLLWRSIYKILADFYEENRGSKGWLVKVHEDICISPLAEFENIFSFFGYPFRENIRNYVKRSSQSDNPIFLPRNKAHFLFRNSKQLAYYWKSFVDKKCVNAVRRITEDIVSNYYDEGSWNI